MWSGDSPAERSLPQSPEYNGARSGRYLDRESPADPTPAVIFTFH